MITDPDEPKAYRPPSPILDTMPLLPATDAGKIVDWLTDRGLGGDEGIRDPQLIALAEYYFGDTGQQASSAPTQRCHRPRARGGPADRAARA